MAQNSARRSRINDKNGEKEKNSNMKVVVRVRPPNSMEISKQSSTSILVMDERVLVFDPKDDSMDYLHGDRRRKQPKFLTRRARDLKFMFDRVFDDGASNRDVFEHTTRAIIDGVLGGYNCTVFAYGATGAGKTFTMLGDSANPGVMFLTMMELYSRINACKDEKSSDVAVSYLEVYNETIRDLLMPGQPLAVREDPQRGVCVSGLTLHKPISAEELLGMLAFGNNNRTQHPTDANAQSSRSHAVFQVFVRQKDRTAGLKANFTMGKMSLIDLAGSERALVTSNRGARFREGANINKSLLALGNCINALADKENKAGHIPYRDSKLTRLLKDSLGGNCRTVMIAAVSPSGLSYEDTYNTLKYADRAMNITCKVVKNEMSVDMHVSRYAKIVEELRAEISELKNKVFGYESGPSTTPKKSADSNAQTQEQIQRLSSSLKCVMKERMVVQKNIIDVEAAHRDLHIKLYRKERNLRWMQIVCIEGEKLDQARSRIQSSTDATNSKQKYLASRKADFEGQLAKNDSWFERIQSEIRLETDPEAQNQLESCKSEVKLQLENMELKRNCQLYKKHVQAQEKDAQNTERLVSTLLSMVQKQFFLLKGVGLATQDLTEEYNTIVEIVENGRKVMWADQSVKENGIGDRFMPLSFHSTSIGTPQARTPIRKRQFDTPAAGSVMRTPCGQASITLKTKAMRTFTLSATPKTCNNRPSIQTTDNFDFVNPCISLTKEFEAISPPVRAPLPIAQRCTGQQTLIPSEISTVQSIQNIATQLKVPGSFTISDNSATLPSATSQSQINLMNNLSNCASRKSTQHPKVCWTDKPVEPECTPAKQAKNKSDLATPLRESNDINISGILPLRETPADRDQHKMSTAQIKRPPMNDPLSTPLRVLPVNKQTGLKDQLPSVLNQLSNSFSKDKSKIQKQSKDMMPKRVCSASKENVQLSKKPLRSSSVLDLDKLHSKKIKKHINGLRRAASSTNIGTSRNFAPRSSPKRSNSVCSWASTDRPRWQ